jgi:hypothetical protein
MLSSRWRVRLDLWGSSLDVRGDEGSELEERGAIISRTSGLNFLARNQSLGSD